MEEDEGDPSDVRGEVSVRTGVSKIRGCGRPRVTALPIALALAALANLCATWTG
jgi:hypothetical protein